MNGNASRTMPRMAKLMYALRGLCLMSNRVDMKLSCYFRLGTIGDTLAHDAGRTQCKHDDQYDECKDVLVVAAEKTAGQVADITGAKAFDQTEQNPTHHCTIDVADAAKHCSGESFQAWN